MWWMWIAGPALIGLVFWLTGARDQRRVAEIERWRRTFGRHDRNDAPAPSFRKKPKPSLPVGDQGPKRVALPGSLHRILDATGGGGLLGHYELVAPVAYISFYEATATQASDHQTVVAKLEHPAPTFTAQPLPVVEGERIKNTGVDFDDDADFMALYLVEPSIEGEHARAGSSKSVDEKVRGWLSRPIRDALRELPEAWLRVEGATMAVTLYGSVSAEQIQALIATADVAFAEHGADGGPSLLGEDDEEDGDIAGVTAEA